MISPAVMARSRKSLFTIPRVKGTYAHFPLERDVHRFAIPTFRNIVSPTLSGPTHFRMKDQVFEYTSYEVRIYDRPL
jgi:hypothetical protein